MSTWNSGIHYLLRFLYFFIWIFLGSYMFINLIMATILKGYFLEDDDEMFDRINGNVK